MHRTRILTAAVILPLLVLYIMYLPPLFFLLLISVIALMGQSEFYSLYGLEKRYKLTGLLFGAAIMYFVYREGSVSDELFAVLFIVVVVIRLFSKRSPAGSAKDISLMTVGCIYVPVLLSYMVKVREFGPQWVIFLLACVWSADSCAYYFGRSFGKARLYESVSPNKTMAGAYGSVLGAALISVALNRLTGLGLTILSSVFLGALIGVVTIIGDLIESMFKRDAGIKDSGSLIPGHGGVLDKIDGMLLVTPVLYWTINRIII